MDDWGQMLRGMVQAVRDEVEHTRRRDVGRTWQLYGGHRAQGPAEGASHYRLHTEGGRTLRPGSQGVLRMAGHAAPATVARSGKGWIELSVLKDPGGPTDEASFLVRDDILISLSSVLGRPLLRATIQIAAPPRQFLSGRHPLPTPPVIFRVPNGPR